MNKNKLKKYKENFTFSIVPCVQTLNRNSADVEKEDMIFKIF